MLSVTGADALLLAGLAIFVVAVVLGWLAGALYVGRKRIDDLYYFQIVSDERWADCTSLLGDVAIALADGRERTETPTQGPIGEPEPAEAVAVNVDVDTPKADTKAPPAREADGRSLADRIYTVMFGDPPPGRSAADDIDGFNERQAALHREGEAARLEGEASSREARREERERLALEPAPRVKRSPRRPKSSGAISGVSRFILELLVDGKVHSADEIVVGCPTVSTKQSAMASISVLRNKVKEHSVNIENVRVEGYRVSEVTLPAARQLLGMAEVPT